MNLQTFFVGVVTPVSGSLVIPPAVVAFAQPTPATADVEVGPTFLVSLGGKLYGDLGAS